MKKLYKKNELAFALIWIGIYVVSLSLADSLSASLGVQKILTTPLCTALSVFLYFWISHHGLGKKYGLCKAPKAAKTNLFYIPLILICTTNVWFGFRLNLSPLETVLSIVSMLCVGFLEEVIFRGFLFSALSKDDLKQAIVISSITFGFGHIVNLLNGAALLEILLQICYACAIGFLFTILFLSEKSLWPCILAHSAVNSLSIVANTEARTTQATLFSALFLCVVPTAYALYIIKHSDPSGDA